MMLEAEWMRFVAALAPIVVVLVLLVLRVPSLWAGCVGLSVAVAGAAFVFQPDLAIVAVVASSLAPTVLEVALILLGGVGLATVMHVSGAQTRISEWLERAESGAARTATLLLLVFGLTPFMESVTGFGLGVVITAPLLIRFGLRPVQAVVAGLLGLVLVPWGSLAPGTLVAAQLGGEDFIELGTWSAILTLPVLLVSMVMVWIVVKVSVTPRSIALAAAVILLQWSVLVLTNAVLGPPLAGVCAAAAVVLFLLGVMRAKHGPLPKPDLLLRRSLLPYAVLVGGIMLATLVISFAGVREGLGWIANPALWLLITVAVSPLILQLPRESLAALGRDIVESWVPVAATALIFMSIGIVMSAAGMAEFLATSAAHSGYGFIAVIPLIGALGGYLTGSNTGAAAMFSAATTTAATGLGASPLIALASQNVAGSFAIIASPARVALAVAVALPKGESLPAASLRTLLSAVITVAVVLGAIVLAIT